LAAQASQTEAVRAIVGEKRYRRIIRVERSAAFTLQPEPESQART
jgi:hypothetical protein